jgi:hypothetical protein
MARGIAGLVGVWLLLGHGVAAQETRPAESTAEDLQPHIVGTLGTTMVGAGGYVDRVYSSERILPLNYTIQVDIGRFVTRRVVVRGGLVGSGSAGGDDADDRPTGIGAPALHAAGGVFYYLTPQSMWSMYGGAQYWTQLSGRDTQDKGSVVGMLGLEGAVSRRLGVYAEGGYGIGLTGPDESTNRIVARGGLRLKF